MDNFTPPERPYKIGILLIDGFALMSYSSAIEPLRAANQLAAKNLYDIRHIPVTGASSTSSSGAVIRAEAHVGEQVNFDLVLVVAGGDPLAFSDSRIFQWLRHLASRKVLLGGVSGGPVILAKAGVMQGRRMTVHWEHARQLAELQPSLALERTLYVIDRDRLTCAGGIAALDMMHTLISEHHNAEFATQVSDWFLHTDIRPSGGPQRAGLAQRYGITSQPVILAIEAMTNHLSDTLSLQQLANLAGVSPRQLNRLFKARLYMTTMAFYRQIRLDKARGLLRRSTFTTTEIALITGFSSSAHFSHAYRKKHGHPPSKVRHDLQI